MGKANFEIDIQQSKTSNNELYRVFQYNCHNLIIKFQLGGLIVEREVRTLCSYLGNLSSFSARDRFGRLTQAAALLAVERPAEAAEWAAGAAWRLSPQEVRQILALRYTRRYRVVSFRRRSFLFIETFDRTPQTGLSVSLSVRSAETFHLWSR